MAVVSARCRQSTHPAERSSSLRNIGCREPTSLAGGAVTASQAAAQKLNKRWSLPSSRPGS